MKTALTIAGSDSSGGAGIQADIKTMMANGVYAMSVITALTAQNTMGVKAIYDVSCEFLSLQIDSVFEDIFPDAVKIGMISSAPLAETIAERLEFYGAKNIVADPVMVSTSGSALMASGAVDILTKKLFPLASLITPNIPEAQVLSKIKINSEADMERACIRMFDSYGCAVLLKGGHGIADANDLLYDGNDFMWFRSKKISNPNTHGTGCTLSSAIASNLAKGYSLQESVKLSKDYVTGAIDDGLDLGRGNGPLNHGYGIKF